MARRLAPTLRPQGRLRDSGSAYEDILAIRCPG